MTVPIITAHFIKHRCEANYPDDPAKEIVEFQHPFAIFQIVTIFYVFFISYHRSPERIAPIWIKIGPIIHAFFIVLDFLIIPLVVIIHFMTKTDEIKQSLFTGPLLIYPLIGIYSMIQLPFYTWNRLSRI